MASSNDILYQAAYVWKRLTEFLYNLTYGYKNQLYTIDLTFSPEDFFHLAGFHYLKDLSLPRYNPRKLPDKILSDNITLTQVQKSIRYKDYVKPRLEALARFHDILEKDFNLFSYTPHTYPFTTTIKAEYLISSHLDSSSFIFIIRAASQKDTAPHYLCCSAFTKGKRNYEINQPSRTILRKKRVHIASGKSKILYDRLS